MGGLTKPEKIMIIELKRGGAAIGYNELYQAENYVRQIKKAGILHHNATISAFVIGAKLGDVDSNRTIDSGRIFATTYGVLVQTAQKKLFRLRQKLNEHYSSMDDTSIIEKALAQIAIDENISRQY
jgi:hypothetical protein